MANTLNRAYPRPDTSRTIAEEFPVSDQALVAIDADIHALFQAVLGLAPLAHTHELADVNGLVAALAGKASSSHAHALDDLTDVSGAAGAADGYVLVKTGAGWIPGSPASVIGSHQHAISDVVNLQTALNNLAAVAQIDAAAVGGGIDGNDLVGFRQNADGAYVKYSWSTMRAGVVVSFGANLASRTEKTALVDADLTVIADSQATNATKRVTVLNLWVGYLKGKADALYTAIADIATAAQFRAKAAGKILTADKVWEGAVPVNLGGALSGNLTLDLNNFLNAYGTATGNIVFNAVSNAKNQAGTIRMTASGADRTVGFNTSAYATPDNKALKTITSGTSRLYSYEYDGSLGKVVIIDLGTVS